VSISEKQGSWEDGLLFGKAGMGWLNRITERTRVRRNQS